MELAIMSILLYVKKSGHGSFHFVHFFIGLNIFCKSQFPMEVIKISNN